MGQVYRARDTRLDRPVALKVLLDHVAANPLGRDRFEREARIVAALNHPHICTLYDVGHQDGTDYLVMEFVEGETLAARLARGPLPLAEALAIATQIAEGLDKAHRSGILHRDLKPGNVMLVKGGTGSQTSVQAKLLDFGLAKLLRPGETVGAHGGDATTRTAPLTGEGTILGTLHYMAPEQIEGREVDVRTDVFALGLVIYEMLTGKRAFEGRSRQALIGAILATSPPPIAGFDLPVSAALDRVVTTCLAKDPDHRRQSVREVLLDLAWVSWTASRPLPAPGSPGSSVAPAWHRYPWPVLWLRWSCLPPSRMACSALAARVLRPSQPCSSASCHSRGPGSSRSTATRQLPSYPPTVVVWRSSPRRGAMAASGFVPSTRRNSKCWPVPKVSPFSPGRRTVGPCCLVWLAL
jgi:serine/threonine protein kinase